ncbi:MAG: hypothetical protein R2824_02240 [Saprospiraceae bacterium]|nr:hypothetical protein [Lewinella sp.]
MSKFNLLILLFIGVIGIHQSNQAFGQRGISNPNLRELPIVLTWGNDGVRITTKTANGGTTNLIDMTPSQFLDQIGNDLIRVAPGAGDTPVIIDMSGFFRRSDSMADANNMYPGPRTKISIHMPKMTLSDYNEPNSFIVELWNFSEETNHSRQVFLFRGLDVFHVGADNCASLSSEFNRIIVNVEKCNVKHLSLKGGLLDLADVEEKIPNLCRKYNDRYYSKGQPDAFVCLEECESEDPKAYDNLQHVRSLITKYNITDFEDAPISFLDEMILTKKGVGLNLKMEYKSTTKSKNKSKKISYDAYDKYRFFPWYEFINLTFTKYVDDNQLMIEDPYNNSYIYNSKVHFSNVELIQFFNELKALISARVNS